MFTVSLKCYPSKLDIDIRNQNPPLFTALYITHKKQKTFNIVVRAFTLKSESREVITVTHITIMTLLQIVGTSVGLVHR